MKSNKKTSLTPCRRVGLSRKSVGSTPPASISQRVNSSTGIVSDSPSNLSHHSEYRRLDSVIDSSSLLVEDQQPASKRLKITMPRCILASSKTKKQSQENSMQNPHNAEIEPYAPRFEDTLLEYNLIDLDASQPHNEPNFGEIQLQIDQIKERLVLKQTQIIDLESQLVNAKQHDLQAVNDLVSKWRLSCQHALNELLTENTKFTENCSMVNLLDSLGIPAELVNYSNTEMDFHD